MIINARVLACPYTYIYNIFGFFWWISTGPAMHTCQSIMPKKETRRKKKPPLLAISELFFLTDTVLRAIRVNKKSRFHFSLAKHGPQAT